MKLNSLNHLHVFTLLLLGSIACNVVRSNDGQLQNEIVRRFNSDPDLNSVTVVVMDGNVTLSGRVASPEASARAESLSRISGVNLVENRISIDAPPEPVASDVDEPNVQAEETWQDRGYERIAEYMKTRMVQCGDSYYLLFGKTGLYQTKVAPVPEIWEERTWPAEALSEADRLNNKTPAPETWQGKWRFTINTPWRYFRERNWDPWRNDSVIKYFSFTYNIEGKWVFIEGITNNGTFNEIGEYKCQGDDIDLKSIPGGFHEPWNKEVSTGNPNSQVTDSNDLSQTYAIVGNTIFNRKTTVVFRTAEEFFKDSGKSSFSGLKYDIRKSLPTGLRFVNGQYLTPEDYKRLRSK